MMFERGCVAVKGKLLLPEAMRAAVGLHDGQVYAAPLPAESIGISPYILTNTHPTRWPDLWRLCCTFGDVPGRLHAVTEFMAALGVRIHINRGANVSPRVEAMVDMHLDLTQYASDVDLSSRERSQNSTVPLSEFRSMFYLTFLNDIVFDAPGEPRCTLQRNQLLWLASKHSPERREFELTGGAIRCADLTGERQSTAARPTRSCTQSTWYTVADPEHLTLLLYRVEPGVPAVHARFHCSDPDRALINLTAGLRRLAFDIELSYLRPAGKRGGVLIDVLLLGERVSPGAGSGELQERCRRVAAWLTNVRKIQSEVTFPPVRGAAA